jgi:hypothetical protein
VLPEIRFEIVGDGPLHEPLRRLIAELGECHGGPDRCAPG